MLEGGVRNYIILQLKNNQKSDLGYHVFIRCTGDESTFTETVLVKTGAEATLITRCPRQESDCEVQLKRANRQEPAQHYKFTKPKNKSFEYDIEL